MMTENVYNDCGENIGHLHEAVTEANIEIVHKVNRKIFLVSIHDMHLNLNWNSCWDTVSCVKLSNCFESDSNSQII